MPFREFMKNDKTFVAHSAQTNGRIVDPALMILINTIRTQSSRLVKS